MRKIAYSFDKCGWGQKLFVSSFKKMHDCMRLPCKVGLNILAVLFIMGVLPILTCKQCGFIGRVRVF